MKGVQDMYKCSDLMEKKPIKVPKGSQADEVIEKLIAGKYRPVLLENTSGSLSVVTPLSALKHLLQVVDLGKVSALDLAEDKSNYINSNLSWIELEKKFIKTLDPLIVMNDKGHVCGTIEIVSLLQGLFSKVKDLRRELDAIINYSNDWVFVADGRGIAQHVNSSFERDFGVKVEEVLGKNVRFLEKEKVFCPSVTKQVLQKKKPQTVIQLQRDGRKLLASGTPVFDEDGSIFRVIVNVRDITRLNELKQQLEETEKLKQLYYQELVELHHGYSANPEIIAYGPSMVNVLKTAKKVASVDSTVLISGETGSGKGIVARYIHDCSSRKDKPFVTVNCGSIPENLIESELFGYVKGAFTGANQQGKIGKLELANHGTLFLDEITELPLDLQVKLLYVIQEGIINRIGDTKDIHLDLRIVAATNRNIQEMVSQGRFRQDLYFRLNVIPLEVPPLKERLEDIESLARHFLDKANKKYDMHKKIDVEVYAYLRCYNWPGNIRELENLIERLVVVADSDLIQAHHLPHYIFNDSESSKEPNFPFVPIQPLDQAKEMLEKVLLAQAVEQFKSTYEIARALDINQSTVVRKLRKYNLHLTT